MKKNSPYYRICTPTENNLGTGNVCFSLDDLIKFDKDFLFDQVVDGVEYSKVLPKEWVRDHMLPMYASRIDKRTGHGKVFQFYVLKINEILAY